MSIDPSEVFTPASPVQEDMFAQRRHADLEARVNLALAQRGRQVILYGDTGVGKTSLVFHLVRQSKFKMVRVECGPDFDETLYDALSAVADEQEVERIVRTRRGADAGIGLGPLKAGVEANNENEQRITPTVRSLAAAVVETLEHEGVRVLFLDNFENVSGTPKQERTTRRVAQLLKSLADRAENGHDHLKAVVAGIPEASEALVTLDDATARRTAQIEVTRMPRDELNQILTRGEKKLRMDFAGLARHMILTYSDGFPYYTHLLALHSSRRAIAGGRDVVDMADFDEALDEILADCDLGLRSAYSRAVETSGEVKMRKSVMEAMASLNDPEVQFKAIREAFLASHPQYGSPGALNFLSTAVKPLKDEYRILADKGMPKSKRNLYRFRNPLMRGYVRLRMRREHGAQGGLWDPMAGYEGDD